MRKITLYFLLFFTLANVLGQDINSLINPINEFEESDANYKVDINLNYFANSNAVTNSFIDAAFADMIIENEQKQDVSNLLKSENRLGYKMEYGGNITFKSNRNNYNIKIGINTVEHLYAEFSDNMFDLFLYGNKHLAGESIELTPFNYTYYSYEKISFGVTNIYNDDKIHLGADLSFIKGSRYQDVYINNATFYTSLLGDSLSLEGKGKGSFSDESKNKLASFNGMGMAINIDLSYLLNKNDFVRVRVNDLGFVNWNNLTNYSLDKSYLFEGLEVDNLINASDSALSDLGIESFGSILGADTSFENKSKLIPVNIEILYLKELNDQIDISAGVKYLLHSGYVPKLFVSAHFSLPWGVKASPIVSIGGYSKVDYGLGVQKTQEGKYSVGFYTYFIEDLILKSKSTGQGLRIYASVYF